MKEKRQDHRTRVTKLLIRKAFTQLLNEKPIQSISVKELCMQAGINRGTFYAHYRDIYDLMEQIEAEMTRDFQEVLKPLLEAKGPDLTPLKITTSIFQCLKENADICAVTLGPHGDKAFARRLINLGQERCLESYAAFLKGPAADSWNISMLLSAPVPSAFWKNGCPKERPRTWKKLRV